MAAYGRPSQSFCGPGKSNCYEEMSDNEFPANAWNGVLKIEQRFELHFVRARQTRGRWRLVATVDSIRVFAVFQGGEQSIYAYVILVSNDQNISSSP